MNDVEKMLQDFMQHARDGGEFIIFDTETTGFSAGRDRILSISAIKATFNVETGEFVEVARLDQYMNPERRISAEITKLTGIDYNRVRNEPTEDEAAMKVAPFFGSRPYIVGQNVNFDIRMMTAMASRCRFPFEPNNVLDTLTLAKKMIGPRSENHKLETLMKFFNIKRDDLRFHESISDVIATGRVVEQFVLLYQDKLDIEKVAADYKKRMESETEFVPVEPESTPFSFNEHSTSTQLLKPTITGLSFWRKYAMKRVYVNVKEEGIKIWYDLVTNEWQTKFEWNAISNAIDWDYVKAVTAEMINQPENEFIRTVIQEAREKKGER